MKEMNIYAEFLEYCEPRTEADIEHIRQLDYQDGKYDDFNAPEHIYGLEEFRTVANRTFKLEEFLNFKYQPGLDPRTKIYVHFKDGNAAAFEILFSEDGLMPTWSSIPKRSGFISDNFN